MFQLSSFMCFAVAGFEFQISIFKFHVSKCSARFLPGSSNFKFHVSICKFQVASSKFRFTSFKFHAPSFQISSCWIFKLSSLQVTIFKFPVFNFQFSNSQFQVSRVSDVWFRVSGIKLQGYIFKFQACKSCPMVRGLISHRARWPFPSAGHRIPWLHCLHARIPTSQCNLLQIWSMLCEQLGHLEGAFGYILKRLVNVGHTHNVCKSWQVHVWKYVFDAYPTV